MKEPTIKQQWDLIERLRRDYNDYPKVMDSVHKKLMMATYKTLSKEKMYKWIKYKKPKKFFEELHKTYKQKIPRKLAI